MTNALYVTGLWRSVDILSGSNGAGFQFTGNAVPTPGGGKGYELTGETVLAAARNVEWMYDPATHKLHDWAASAYRVLTQAVAAKGLAGNDEAIGSSFNDVFRTGAGDDRVYARAGNDVIDGGSGNDILHGQEGNDTIVGGTGADRMFGGEGDDTFYVDNMLDQITEGSGGGRDTAYASVSYALGKDQWVETLAAVSRTAKDAIDLTGNEYAQAIVGNAENNVLKGLAGNDAMSGEAGNDRLFGGAGSDRLTGGLGNDAFVFDARPDAWTNVDTITDFRNVAGNDDFFQLDHAVFAALTRVGALAAGAFMANAGGHATQADDRILYDTGSGKLFYDADGSGKGAAVQFAVLSDHPALTAADFFVI